MVVKKLKEGGGHAAQLARLGELKMVILQAIPLISLKVTRKRSESVVHGESLRVFRLESFRGYEVTPLVKSLHRSRQYPCLNPP